jgi:hypothetical protein
MKLTDMTLNDLQAEMDKNADKRTELIIQKEPIDKKLERLWKRKEKLQDQFARLKAGGKTIDWDWLLHSNHDDGSMQKHNLLGETLRKMNLDSTGFFIETEQVCIRIALIKNEPTSLPDTLKGLKEILKRIKPLKDGFKHIGIHEVSNCENGIYALLIDEAKGKYVIELTRYRREEVLSVHKTLRAALKEIQKKYYCEDRCASEEDEGYFGSENYW